MGAGMTIESEVILKEAVKLILSDYHGSSLK
jgi:hypothetical protein